VGTIVRASCLQCERFMVRAPSDKDLRFRMRRLNYLRLRTLHYGVDKSWPCTFWWRNIAMNTILQFWLIFVIIDYFRCQFCFTAIVRQGRLLTRNYFVRFVFYLVWVYNALVIVFPFRASDLLNRIFLLEYLLPLHQHTMLSTFPTCMKSLI
jgi:hypothetical protein